MRRLYAVSLVLLLASSAAGAQGSRITLSERPLVRIGQEGDSTAEFTRITGAIELPSGQIVVSDARSAYIRVFRPDGRFERNLGRVGAGPGEFRNVTLLPPAGDTVLVWDAGLRRLTLYSPQGRLAGSLRVTASGGSRPIGLVGRLPNGRWLVATSYVPSLMRSGGTYADSVRVGTIAASGGGDVAWIGWYPGATFWVWKPNAGSDHGESVGFARFGAITRVLTSGANIVIASGGTNEIHVLDATGRIVRRLSTPARPKLIADAERARARDAALAQAESERSRALIEASYARSATPAAGPAFDDVRAVRGDLWIQKFTTDPAAPQQYTVIRLDGTVVGQLMLPSRARLIDAGTNYAWVVTTDDDGVERLEKYAIRRR
jgi:hypothetical protein